jgi:hypothetical protein
MSDLSEELETQTTERAQRKRGRPPGSTTRKRRHLLESSRDPEARTLFTPHKLASRYQDEIKAYEKSALTQRKLLIIRRIAGSRTFALETQRGAVNKQLLDVSKLLCLTELELVGWDLYLSNTQWMGLPVSLQTLLLVSGFFVKSLMSAEDTTYISTCLIKQVPQFQAGLSLWNTYCGSSFSIAPKALLTRYQELTSPAKATEPVNYNFYVDEIINLGVSDERTSLQTFQDYVPMQLPEPRSPVLQLPVMDNTVYRDNGYREENVMTPMLQMEDFGMMTPMLIPYPFAFYTPPQSALPLLEDLGSAFLGPKNEE